MFQTVLQSTPSATVGAGVGVGVGVGVGSTVGAGVGSGAGARILAQRRQSSQRLALLCHARATRAAEVSEEPVELNFKASVALQPALTPLSSQPPPPQPTHHPMQHPRTGTDSALASLGL